MEAIVSAQGRMLGRDQMLTASVDFLVQENVVLFALPQSHPAAKAVQDTGCFVLNWQQLSKPVPCVKLLDCVRIGKVWWECELLEQPQAGSVCVFVGRIVHQA